jgi:hypothetical protein
MKIEEIFSIPPPFERPANPRTKDELARWIAWERWELGGSTSPVQYHRNLLTFPKWFLVRRYERMLAARPADDGQAESEK